MNQSVLLQQLEALGLKGKVRSDGESALQALMTSEFDLLLTDFHMPRMDGLRLAAAVREWEERTGRSRRVPIVLLTADISARSAFDRVAGGIDAHLTKPVQIATLAATLSKLLSDPVDTPEPRMAKPQKSKPSIVDLDVLASLVGDDPAVQRRLLDAYIKSASRIEGEIVQAAVRSDRGAIRANAHKLKSAARSIGAIALAKACQLLEQSGSLGDEDLEAMLASLLKNIRKVDDRLARIVGESGGKDD